MIDMWQSGTQWTMYPEGKGAIELKSFAEGRKRPMSRPNLFFLLRTHRFIIRANPHHCDAGNSPPEELRSEALQLVYLQDAG